ncbi:myosin-binding protein 7-like [Typha angustifolia]|uniref:myosin-binding protein 7-like n=1 Tax=Typha angustifolia TaxID=59011 RepID=UPI003C303337
MDLLPRDSQLCPYSCPYCSSSAAGASSSSKSTWRRSVKRKPDPTVYRGQEPAEAARVELESELAELRETIKSQEATIQELIADLEEERNASSTATSEAMSMIQRLQREKAEAQMESRQLKRFADEKIGHEEEQIQALEDLLLKREQEIESISYQLESYRKRLEDHHIALDDDEDEDASSNRKGDDFEGEELKKKKKKKAEEFRFGVDHPSEDGSDASDRVYTIDAVYAKRGEKDAGERDTKKLSMRLEALEADRDSMRKAIVAMRTERAQLVALREIAQQLCKEVAQERRIVKKTSLNQSFSIVAIVKWVLSVFFWRKRASGSRSTSGLFNYNVGLLLLLQKLPLISQWRSLSGKRGQCDG